MSQNEIPNILVDSVSLRNKPLSNLEIIEAAKRLSLNGFRGEFLRDTFSKKAKLNKWGILNLDSSSGDGTHWVMWLKMTDNTLFTFPAANAFASGKIMIYEMWVERLADEWVSTSSPMFATEWPGFHKFSRGPTLMTFFNGSPPVVGLVFFRLDYIELP